MSDFTTHSSRVDFDHKQHTTGIRIDHQLIFQPNITYGLGC